MSPEANLSKLYRSWSLVVDEQELRRLVDECQRALAEEDSTTDPTPINTNFSVEFSDGLTFRLEYLDAVLGEENPRGRSITGIQLQLKTASASIVCRLGLEPGHASRISVTSTDRQWVYVTFSRIEERLRRMKQWHPRSNTVGLATGLVAAVTSVSFWVIATTRYPGLLVHTTRRADGSAEATFFGFFSLLGAILLAILVGRCMAILFQDPIFRIGGGTARHDRLKSVRSKLGWTLLAVCVLTPLFRMLSYLVW